MFEKGSSSRNSCLKRRGVKTPGSNGFSRDVGFFETSIRGAVGRVWLGGEGVDFPRRCGQFFGAQRKNLRVSLQPNNKVVLLQMKKFSFRPASCEIFSGRRPTFGSLAPSLFAGRNFSTGSRPRLGGRSDGTRCLSHDNSLVAAARGSAPVN